MINEGVSIGRVMVAQASGFVYCRVEIIVPLNVRPILLFILLSPMILVITCVVFNAQPRRRIVGRSTAAMSNSRIVKVGTLVVDRSSIGERFLPLRVAQRQVDSLVRFLIQVLSFVVRVNR